MHADVHGGELDPASPLVDIVDRAPAAVSQHLAKLRRARLVTVRQEGSRAFYRLRDERPRRLVIEALRQTERAVSGEPRHHAGG